MSAERWTADQVQRNEGCAKAGLANTNTTAAKGQGDEKLSMRKKMNLANWQESGLVYPY